MHAELSGGANQQSRPPMRRAHASLRLKALVMPFVGVAAIGRLRYWCTAEGVMPLLRRTAPLWMRRSWSV